MQIFIAPLRGVLHRAKRLCLLAMLCCAVLPAHAEDSPDLSAILGNPDLFPVLGPDTAKTTVIEFADYQCPYCAMATALPSWVDQFQSRYYALIGAAKLVEDQAKQGNIRFIFVPLSFLDSRSDATSKESTWAAQAAFCAKDQDRFWQMHEAIYAASDSPDENTGKYRKRELKRIAAQISGLDMQAFGDCLDNDKTLDKVQQVMDTVRKAGFKISTPQFWVNDKEVKATRGSLSAALGL